jgi:hypothetical protein
VTIDGSTHRCTIRINRANGNGGGGAEVDNEADWSSYDPGRLIDSQTFGPNKQAVSLLWNYHKKAHAGFQAAKQKINRIKVQNDVRGKLREELRQSVRQELQQIVREEMKEEMKNKMLKAKRELRDESTSEMTAQMQAL